jgi:hypothetical protein
MPLVVHQALKDARLLKWILAVWVLVNVAMQVFVLVAVHQPPPVTPHSPNVAVAVYSALCGLLVAGFIAVSVVAVQHDPGVGGGAFWFTRPISVRALLGAKFLLLVPAVVLLPVVLDVLALLTAGVPPASTFRPALMALAIQVAWLLPVMAIAAFTTDLAQFVLGVILEVLIFIAANAFVPWLLAFRRGTLFFATRTATPFILMLVVLSFVVIVLAYRSRSARRSAIAAGAAPIVIGGLLLAWPADIRPTFGSRVAPSITLRVGGAWRPRPTQRSDCQVAVSVDLSGIPRTQTVELVPYAAWLQYENRRVDVRQLTLTAPPGALTALPGGGNQAPAAWVEAAAGPVTAQAEPQPARSYSIYGIIPAAECRDQSAERVTLGFDLSLVAVEYSAAAALPLHAGAAGQLNLGRAEILEVARAPHVITVRARQTGLETRLGRLVQPALRAANSGRVMLAARSEIAASPFLSMIIPVPQHLGSTWWALDFPDAEWLRDPQLVLVEAHSAGTADRRIEVPNIVLSSLPQEPPR